MILQPGLFQGMQDQYTCDSLWCLFRPDRECSSSSGRLSDRTAERISQNTASRGEGISPVHDRHRLHCDKRHQFSRGRPEYGFEQASFFTCPSASTTAFVPAWLQYTMALSASSSYTFELHGLIFFIRGHIRITCYVFHCLNVVLHLVES